MLLRVSRAPIDVTFYSTYALQVSALLDGQDRHRLELPAGLARLATTDGRTCRAIAMRDTDRDRVSYLVARTDGPVRTIDDLRGSALAVGAIGLASGDAHPAWPAAAGAAQPDTRSDGDSFRRAGRQTRRPCWRRAGRVPQPSTR